MPSSVSGRMFLNGSSPTPALSALFDTNLSGTSLLFARTWSGTRESFSCRATSLTSRTTFASVTAARIRRRPSPSSGRTSILIFDLKGRAARAYQNDKEEQTRMRPGWIRCSLFLYASFIPYNRPVYPGALRVRRQWTGCQDQAHLCSAVECLFIQRLRPPSPRILKVKKSGSIEPTETGRTDKLRGHSDERAQTFSALSSLVQSSCRLATSWGVRTVEFTYIENKPSTHSHGTGWATRF